MSLGRHLFIAGLILCFIVIVFFLILPQPRSTSLVNTSPKKPILVSTQTPPTPIPPPAPKYVHQTVPFTPQSPLAQWSDPRQEDACEEGSVLMAIKWARNEQIDSPQAAKDEILAISHFETDTYGDYHDTSASDTINRIVKAYYHYENVQLKTDITLNDIVTELEQGNLVNTPMNGQALKNPHFSNRGPERHMILIIGYDPQTEEFITNDTGIKEGKDYRYPTTLFFNAIRDYPTGDHLPIIGVEKNMIVIKKP